jgi:uncharacterized protein (TIGR02466 family)
MNENKKITAWFPTLIYQSLLPEFLADNSALENKVYNIQKLQSESKTNWSCDTYTTLLKYNGLADTDPIIQNLIAACKEKVADFATEYGLGGKINDLECIDFWFNVAAPGSYQEYHIHAKSHFSLIYYVKTKPKCGNIVFQSSESLVDMFPLLPEEPSYASYKTCFYTPVDSMLLIFRSNLLHMVEKNLSNEDRISIAMNFTF